MRDISGAKAEAAGECRVARSMSAHDGTYPLRNKLVCVTSALIGHFDLLHHSLHPSQEMGPYVEYRGDLCIPE